MRRTLIAAILLALTANAHAAFLIYDETAESNAIWYVGQPRPTLDGYNYGDAMYCQAWDNELMFIQRHYTGIRTRSGPTAQGVTIVSWLDEDCEFLLGNL